MPIFNLYWSPEGKRIATVEASDASAAKRKAPKPYRRALGEIYADELLVRAVYGIYIAMWFRSGKCEVISQVNGATLGTWDHGDWYDGSRIPDAVKAVAMECRPLPQS